MDLAPVILHVYLARVYNDGLSIIYCLFSASAVFPWITKETLTSTMKKIQCFKLMSLLVIHWNKVSFGVTRIYLQKLNHCLKRFTISLNLTTTKEFEICFN